MGEHIVFAETTFEFSQLLKNIALYIHIYVCLYVALLTLFRGILQYSHKSAVQPSFMYSLDFFYKALGEYKEYRLQNKNKNVLAVSAYNVASRHAIFYFALKFF